MFVLSTEHRHRHVLVLVCSSILFLPTMSPIFLEPVWFVEDAQPEHRKDSRQNRMTVLFFYRRSILCENSPHGRKEGKVTNCLTTNLLLGSVSDCVSLSVV